MSCDKPQCHVPLRKGWNTWIVARVIEPDSEVTAEEVRAEIAQLMGLTPAGILTSVGTWMPSANVSNIGVHTFLGGEAPNYTDAAELGDAEREIAHRAWGDVGIRGAESVPDGCITVAGPNATLVLVDFYWRGEDTQVPWPTTRWVRTPEIPFVMPAARVPRWCSTDVDIYLAEYWGEQGEREAPKTLTDRAEETLSKGLNVLKTAATAGAEAWLTWQVAVSAAGVGLLLAYLKWRSR